MALQCLATEQYQRSFERKEKFILSSQAPKKETELSEIIILLLFLNVK
jgi:hypothetical protein